MARFLEHCEKRGTDPVTLAFSGRPPGVLCTSCLFTSIADDAADGDPSARHAVSQMRLAMLGIEELPDGKGLRISKSVDQDVVRGLST
jgi:hypothetical protein